MTKFLAIAGVVGLLGAGTGWMATSAIDTTRPDCPGKIVCPLSGVQVCVDRCPVSAPQGAVTVTNTADELCGGACPAPGQAPEPSAVAPRANPLKGGCCR